MCKVDWEFELGQALDGCRLYSSIEDLRKNRGCVDVHGVVQVDVRLKEVISNDNQEVSDIQPIPTPSKRIFIMKPSTTSKKK